MTERTAEVQGFMPKIGWQTQADGIPADKTSRLLFYD